MDGGLGFGHWDGDTLVVDTTNFTNKTRYNGSGEQLHVVERFTRTDANTILYRFTVEDPTTWDRSWTGEYPWRATDEKLYEYACHEGNYSLGGMLRGARQKEAEDAAGKKSEKAVDQSGSRQSAVLSRPVPAPSSVDDATRSMVSGVSVPRPFAVATPSIG